MTEITCPCCGHPMVRQYNHGWLVGCMGCLFGIDPDHYPSKDAAESRARPIVRAELSRLINDRVLHGTWYRETDELPREYSILDATRSVLGEYAWRADNPLRLPGEPE